MPLSRRQTLTQYLIDQRRRFPQASGELNALILDVSHRLQGDRARGRLRRTRRRGRHAVGIAGGDVNVQGEVQKKLDVVSNQMFIATAEWSGHLAGMASEEMDRPVPDPAVVCARQVPARVRPARRFVQHRRQRLGGQHLLDPARAAGGARVRPRRHRGRLPAARRHAGGGRLRALRPGDDARAHGGQRRRRLHARPEPGRVHGHAPEHHACRPTRRNSRSTPRTAASGSRRSSATSTNAWPARRARAARTSTCAGSPAWWPRRIAS